MPGSLPKLHERRGVAEKLLSSGRERRACFVAHEQRPAELLFKRFDASADGRLSDVEALGSSKEAAG